MCMLQDFLETVAGEIQYQVRRLAHHPSLAIWSGNNENQVSQHVVLKL